MWALRMSVRRGNGGKGERGEGEGIGREGKGEGGKGRESVRVVSTDTDDFSGVGFQGGHFLDGNGEGKEGREGGERGKRGEEVCELKIEQRNK